MKQCGNSNFALTELVVIICVIAVLSIITIQWLSSRGIGHRAAALRTAAEIGAFSYALEAFKTDRGYYPPGTASGSDPKNYIDSALSLYTNLSGKNSFSATNFSGPVYLAFKSSQVGRSGAFSYVQDVYGYAYGYRTNGLMNPGYYDLWSTGGSVGNSAENTNRWITNWTAN